MQAVTYSQVQELVASLPATKLSLAYKLLYDLVPGPSQRLSPQEKCMTLPLSERQQLLSEQASELVEHYTKDTEERDLWQGGDFEDY